MAAVLKVKNLVKKYGNNTAVDSLSFDVEKGSIFAFLGENGAGKTTTISCLTGIIDPTSGDIDIVGEGSPAQSIGVVFQQSVLDPLLTARENLEMRARLYPGVTKERIDDLINRIDITDFEHRRYGLLSGGEKRRTDIARALLHDPVLLILDEPSSGLDPRSRHQVWETINSLRDDSGLTVFLTTHYMEETELADDVLIIEGGQQVASGTPMELRARYSPTQLILRSDAPVELAEQLRGQDPIIDGDRVRIVVNDGLEAARLAVSLEHVLDVEIRHGSMDQVFLALTSPGNPVGMNHGVGATS
ncbi:ABC transporter ATP-binding protein [uncultured Corynebacterium sp.]|uniref:ABC transporter ATP-binding protein n=1 Tax=uncultured Corynebacterium sp. TaxID=159447 RepID=UPI0025FBC14E|nr:ABC transporter ATP-binding protein [uncultured Corynebacterium sp.]